jgi:general secretion pathway protein G
MKRMAICLAAALLTFTLGVTCTMTPRVITAYRTQALRSREGVLRAELLEMRKAIRQYRSETGTPPRSLIQLVEAGYLKELPLDPITEIKDWDEETIDLRGQLDILILQDVHSLSPLISSEGTPYNEW